MIESSPGYEIRCNHCSVSFPPETKRCLHCGASLGGRGRARAASSFLPGLLEEETDPVDEPESRGLFRFGMSGAVWVLLALSATCYRACAGPG